MTPDQELEHARIRTIMVYAAKNLRNAMRGFVSDPVTPETIARVTAIATNAVLQMIADAQMHPKTEVEVVPDPDVKNGVILRFKTPTKDGVVNDDIFYAP